MAQCAPPEFYHKFSPKDFPLKISVEREVPTHGVDHVYSLSCTGPLEQFVFAKRNLENRMSFSYGN